MDYAPLWDYLLLYADERRIYSLILVALSFTYLIEEVCCFCQCMSHAIFRRIPAQCACVQMFLSLSFSLEVMVPVYKLHVLEQKKPTKQGTQCEKDEFIGELQ